MASNPLKQTSSEITYTYEGTSGARYVLTKVRVGGRYEWDWTVALPDREPEGGRTLRHTTAKWFFQRLEEAADDTARLEMLGTRPTELDNTTDTTEQDTDTEETDADEGAGEEELTGAAAFDAAFAELQQEPQPEAEGATS